MIMIFYHQHTRIYYWMAESFLELNKPYVSLCDETRAMVLTNEKSFTFHSTLFLFFFRLNIANNNSLSP